MTNQDKLRLYVTSSVSMKEWSLYRAIMKTKEKELYSDIEEIVDNHIKETIKKDFNLLKEGIDYEE